MVSGNVTANAPAGDTRTGTNSIVVAGPVVCAVAPVLPHPRPFLNWREDRHFYRRWRFLSLCM
jgi:hypothetical protein